MPQILYCKKCDETYFANEKHKCRKSKYNARAIVVDEHRFPSQHEANRYCELKMLERAGKIHNLEIQVPYKITSGKKPRKYIADFQYINTSGATVVEDAKGYKTEVYVLKKELMKTLYNITIIEV